MTAKQAITQKAINEKVENILENMDAAGRYKYVGQLRSCSAWIYENAAGYILRSYNTIIAAVDRRGKNAVDFLRTVYGYTRTSSQHINKFFADYIPGAWKNTDGYTFLTTRGISDADAEKAAKYLKKLAADV